MVETYKKIEGFKNYSVSDHGNVRNDKTSKVIKTCPNSHGYGQVQLWDEKKRHTQRVHILVAHAFLDNDENKKMVDHIDGDRMNNDVFNLRWATRSENGQNRKLNKNNTTGVKGVSFDTRVKKYYASIQIDGISVQLGCFDNLEDAKKARIIKANQAFGIFTNECELIL